MPMTVGEQPLLNSSQILAIASDIESHHYDNDDDIAELRTRYPDLRFTLCSEDDMGFNEPFKTFSYFDLFLVAHRLDGCSSLTQYVENCTGFVIALHEE